MQRELRLTRKKDFSSVQRKGRRWANRLLILRAQQSDSPTSRFGFVVGRRVGTAVTRNTVKRRLRAAVQNISVKPGWDMVFISRAATADASFQELDKAVKELLGRAEIIVSDEEE